MSNKSNNIETTAEELIEVPSFLAVYSATEASTPSTTDCCQGSICQGECVQIVTCSDGSTQICIGSQSCDLCQYGSQACIYLCEVCEGQICFVEEGCAGQVCTSAELCSEDEEGNFVWSWAGLDTNGNPIEGDRKIKGYGLYITYTEWNNFVKSANNTLGTNLLTVSQNTPISANIVNTAANAVGIPTVNPDEPITAHFFNSLIDALNSF